MVDFDTLEVIPDLKGGKKTYPLCYLQNVIVNLKGVGSITKETKEDECK